MADSAASCCGFKFRLARAAAENGEPVPAAAPLGVAWEPWAGGGTDTEDGSTPCCAGGVFLAPGPPGPPGRTAARIEAMSTAAVVGVEVGAGETTILYKLQVCLSAQAPITGQTLAVRSTRSAVKVCYSWTVPLILMLMLQIGEVVSTIPSMSPAALFGSSVITPCKRHQRSSENEGEVARQRLRGSEDEGRDVKAGVEERILIQQQSGSMSRLSRTKTSTFRCGIWADSRVFDRTGGATTQTHK